MLTDVTKGAIVGRVIPRADSAKRSTRKHNMTSKFLLVSAARFCCDAGGMIFSSSSFSVLIPLLKVKNNRI